MFFPNYYYYGTLLLQLICVWHCIKKGNQQKWIWIIIFLPVIGSIIYFFSEIVSGRDVNRLSLGVGSVIDPGRNIRKLEAQLKFADTHQNRVALADAWLQKGEMEKAIKLYEGSLTGVFAENEYVFRQLIIAYAKAGTYDKIIPLAKKVYYSPGFLRSAAHIAYAKALTFIGQFQLAEKEFQNMNGKFADYEPRYHYGLFLLEQGRTQEAMAIFTEMVEEKKHLGLREKKLYSMWIGKAKEELKKMEAKV